jgi:iron(III) transport system substrate-binding protein
MMAAIGACLLAVMGRSAAAESLSELADKTPKGSEIVWYEANPPEMGDKVVAEFKKQFQNVTLRFERVTGAQGLFARILQETEAKAPTADVVTTGIDQIYALHEKSLSASVKWQDYGLPEAVAKEPYAVTTATTTWVIIYNTDQTPKAEAPKSWSDLLDPKWKGRKIGLWAIGHAQANLAAVWGEQKVDDYVKKLVDQQPLLYKSTYPVTQNVASGELVLGIVPVHVAHSAMAAGAPIGVVFAEPVPLSIISSGILANSPNPNGARLLVAWLSSKEGALAYEKAMGRGNPYLPYTETAKLLQGKTLSVFPATKTNELQRLVSKYTEMLRSAGAAR